MMLPNVKRLKAIKLIALGIYQVDVIADDGEVLSTICRVHSEEILRITFDSDAFNKEATMGGIFIRPICHAIGVFHKVASDPNALSE